MKVLIRQTIVTKCHHVTETHTPSTDAIAPLSLFTPTTIHQLLQCHLTDHNSKHTCYRHGTSDKSKEGNTHAWHL